MKRTQNLSMWVLFTAAIALSAPVHADDISQDQSKDAAGQIAQDNAPESQPAPAPVMGSDAPAGLTSDNGGNLAVDEAHSAKEESAAGSKDAAPKQKKSKGKKAAKAKHGKKAKGCHGKVAVKPCSEVRCLLEKADETERSKGSCAPCEPQAPVCEAVCTPAPACSPCETQVEKAVCGDPCAVK